MTNFPTGKVTFLFTDIEGSTRLWEDAPDAMRGALARHDDVLRGVIEAAGGVVFKTVGDAFCAAFGDTDAAVRAAVAGQRALRAEAWPEAATLRVRMALHTGVAQERDRDYFGPVVNRVARLLAAGYGGQTLVSGACFEQVRQRLTDPVALVGLGTHRLKDLERPEEIYQIVHPDLPEAFPPLKTLTPARSNLPIQLTSFIGREKEISRARAQLATTRLLTLAGPGGTGKTRLSQQVAADVLDDFADGIWLVELAPLSDPALVPQTVAQALGVREQSQQSLTETIEAFLKPKTLLLLLDNCEHILPGCATLAATLLRSCPHLRIITTSREPLGIAGEVVSRVPSLSLPDTRTGTTPTAASLEKYESARLLIERAQLVKADFTVTDRNAPVLAQICCRLDGIPLAMELAAARVRSLSVEQINDKLDSRFRLLTGGDKSALPRQQTLRALVDWSYDLLTRNEQTLLGRLSVFAGGWTLEAAEVVCGFDPLDDWEVLDLLTSLVDKSLVVAEDGQDQTRYRLLETLRQYGTEKRTASDENAALVTRHQDYYLALAQEAEPKLTGPEQADWLRRLESEHDNFRVVLNSPGPAPDSDELSPLVRLTRDLWKFWEMRGYYTEGRAYVARALAQTSNAEATVRVPLLNGAGILAWRQADYTEARARQTELLQLHRESGNTFGQAAALGNLANVVSEQGDFAGAVPLHTEALALFRKINHKFGQASTLGNLGNVAFHLSDLPQARAWQNEALLVFREVGYKPGEANTLNNLGQISLGEGDLATAHSLFEDALARFREIGSRQGEADSLAHLGKLAGRREEWESAQAHSHAAMLLYHALGNKNSEADAHAHLGVIAVHQGDITTAQTAYHAALALAPDPPTDDTLHTLHTLHTLLHTHDTYST